MSRFNHRRVLRNVALQRHISHVILIDTETEAQIRELTSNCVSFAEELSDVFYDASSALIARKYKYRVVLALPESYSNLARITAKIETEMKSAGISFSVNMVRDEDMFFEGKLGLWLCSLWMIGGAVLLNDVPIPPTAVEHIVDLANRLSWSGEHLVLRKAGWFGTDFHIGLLANASSMNYLLKGSLWRSRFGPDHSLGDILRFMKSNCRRGELLVTRF